MVLTFAYLSVFFPQKKHKSVTRPVNLHELMRNHPTVTFTTFTVTMVTVPNTTVTISTQKKPEENQRKLCGLRTFIVY